MRIRSSIDPVFHLGKETRLKFRFTHVTSLLFQMFSQNKLSRMITLTETIENDEYILFFLVSQCLRLLIDKMFDRYDTQD